MGEERTRSCNKLSEVKESESKCSNKVLAAFCLFKIHNFKASLRASGTTVPVMGCSPNKPVPCFSHVPLHSESRIDSSPPKVSSLACGWLRHSNEMVQKTNDTNLVLFIIPSSKQYTASFRHAWIVHHTPRCIC